MNPQESRGPKPKKSRREVPTSTPAPAPAPTPALLSFSLSPETVRVAGGYGISFAGSVTCDVGLDAAAPPGGVRVDIFLVDAKLFLLPGTTDPGYADNPKLVMSIVIAESEAKASKQLDYGGENFGDFVYEARLGTVTKTAVLHTIS